MEFVVDAADWLVYVEAVGDNNDAHRSRNFVRNSELLKKLGVKDIIAPGMWLASHIQDKFPVSNVKSMGFSKFVYSGDVLNMVRKGNDYIISRGDEVVCEVKGVNNDVYKGSHKDLKEVLYTYDLEITDRMIDNYATSLGKPGLGGNPDMYLASLSAPALLAYGEKSGLTGLHVGQSFSKYGDFHAGHVKVLIGDKKIRKSKEGDLCILKELFVQDDKVIGGGKSRVLTFAV